MPENPNPQGKANLPLLHDLQAWRANNTPVGSARDVMVDYLSGLLVLSSEFNFRPVPERAYYLYFRDKRWQLSLIAPGEWRPGRLDSYVARCRLQHDASWAIDPADNIGRRPGIVAALKAYRQDFEERVQTPSTIESNLPHYVRELPYYRRVLASGLASSLQASLRNLGLQHTSGQQLLAELKKEALFVKHSDGETNSSRVAP